MEYRNLSVLAVVSLVLGLAAPLSLFAPLLLGVAFLGAAVALVALRRIAASEGSMTGRGAALVGLALCVASAAAVAGRTVSINHLLARQASRVATQWFELLQSGSPEQAFELTVDAVRASSPRAAQEHESEEEHDHPQSALERFLEDPLVGRLMQLGEGALVEWDRNLALEIDKDGLGTIQQRYQITPAASQDESPIFVRLTLQRARAPGETRPRWMVSAFEREDVPPADAAAG